MGKKLLLTIESEFANVRLVAASLRGLCNDVIRTVDPRDIEMCVVEGLNNAIEHAYLGRPDGVIEVGVTVLPAALEISITDRGAPAPADPLECAGDLPAFDPDDIQSLPEGGFGFPILRKCMDELRYASADGVNTLSMKKAF